MRDMPRLTSREAVPFVDAARNGQYFRLSAGDDANPSACGLTSVGP